MQIASDSHNPARKLRSRIQPAIAAERLASTIRSPCPRIMVCPIGKKQMSTGQSRSPHQRRQNLGCVRKLGSGDVASSALARECAHQNIKNKLKKKKKTADTAYGT